MGVCPAITQSDSQDAVRYALVCAISTSRCTALRIFLSFAVYRSVHPVAAYATTPREIVESVLHLRPHSYQLVKLIEEYPFRYLLYSLDTYNVIRLVYLFRNEHKVSNQIFEFDFYLPILTVIYF